MWVLLIAVLVVSALRLKRTRKGTGTRIVLTRSGESSPSCEKKRDEE